MAEIVNIREPERRHGKSAAAFRTISEVSSELDVPPHVLRFWESKFSQVKPLKRGGGRRYYRPEDIGLLQRIRELLYTEGYTIKGVQKLLREGAVSAPPTTAPRARATAVPAVATDQQAELREILTELESLAKLLRGVTA